MAAPELNVMQQGGKYYFYCPTHMYIPGANTNPVPGCANCWRASLITTMAKQKDAETKLEFTEGLAEFINHLVESEARGEGQFNPSLDIKISKEN